MMKKEIRMLAVFVLLLGLPGCASAEGAPEQMITMAAEIQETAGMPQENRDETIAFSFLDEVVIPGKNLPKKVEEAANNVHQVTSCVAAGMETLYQYDGFDITVHNGSTSDLVYSIYFQSSDVSTTEGLSIGDSLDTVREIYGEADTQGGFTWIYSDGNTELILLISEDTVVGIEYRMAN